MLSVALMGHPKRRAFIDQLLPKLPGAEVVLDEKNDRWDTGRRSLLAFDPAAAFHLVVQDDAVLSKDFVRACEVVAGAAGERPVALYTGKIRPHQHTVTPAVRHARRIGAPWLEMEGPWWGVAIIVPSAHIPELVHWGDAHPTIRNYDRRIAAWYEDRGIKCWYTVPSLVDHRPVAENPSLIAGRSGNRCAHWFIGENRSGLEVDWTRPPLPISASFRNRETGKRTTVTIGGPRYRRLARLDVWEEAA